ncbi:MAG: hypothetical protein ACYCZH_08705 [Sulfuriferula sp.]
MSGRQWLLRAGSTIGMVLCVSLSANASLFGRSKSWKEEVLLHDGQKMVVERHFNLGPPSFESRERKELDETVTFTLPESNKKITWKTDFNDFSPEPNDLSILLLDIVNGTPYIATRPAGCIGFNKWKRPNPPYIFFKYDGKDWKRISLEEFPAVLTKTNIIVGSPHTDLLKPFYTVGQVEEQNRDIQAEGYKTIIRKPFAIEENRCPELVYYKGAWVGPGDSIGRRMMDHHHLQ